MMKNFITCDQMKFLEKRADESGLSYYQMMENAGSAATALILKEWGHAVSGSEFLLFCGKGNNGGDGFVAARLLADQGGEVTVILVDGPPVTKDAITNFNLIRDRLPVIDMTRTDAPFMELHGRPDVVIDSIYGTGFHGNLAPNALKAAAFINRLSREKDVFIASLDIPSGLGGDATGESQIDSNGVRAHCTITFHNKKPVHLQAFAEKYCGRILVADIGIKEELLR